MRVSRTCIVKISHYCRTRCARADGWGDWVTSSTRRERRRRASGCLYPRLWTRGGREWPSCSARSSGTWCFPSVMRCTRRLSCPAPPPPASTASRPRQLRSPQPLPKLSPLLRPMQHAPSHRRTVTAIRIRSATRPPLPLPLRLASRQTVRCFRLYSKIYRSGETCFPTRTHAAINVLAAPVQSFYFIAFDDQLCHMYFLILHLCAE